MILETPETETNSTKRQVWNARKTVGAMRALEPKRIREIQFYLDERRRIHDHAQPDLANDSKLRGSDFIQIKIGVRRKIGDIVSDGQPSVAPFALSLTEPCHIRQSSIRRVIPSLAKT